MQAETFKIEVSMVDLLPHLKFVTKKGESLPMDKMIDYPSSENPDAISALVNARKNEGLNGYWTVDEEFLGYHPARVVSIEFPKLHYGLEGHAKPLLATIELMVDAPWAVAYDTTGVGQGFIRKLAQKHEG